MLYLGQNNTTFITFTIENQILDKVKKAKRGSLFFGESFLSKENSEGVRKALQRLVKKGELIRSNRYLCPSRDTVIGAVMQLNNLLVKNDAYANLKWAFLISPTAVGEIKKRTE